MRIPHPTLIGPSPLVNCENIYMTATRPCHHSSVNCTEEKKTTLKKLTAMAIYFPDSMPFGSMLAMALLQAETQQMPTEVWNPWIGEGGWEMELQQAREWKWGIVREDPNPHRLEKCPVITDGFRPVAGVSFQRGMEGLWFWRDPAFWILRRNLLWTLPWIRKI